MKRVSVMMFAIALLSGASPVAWATNVGGNVARGEKVFKKCAACHTLKPRKHRVGPALFGVLGRLAGSADGYKYSIDMKAAPADYALLSARRSRKSQAGSQVPIRPAATGARNSSSVSAGTKRRRPPRRSSVRRALAAAPGPSC